MAWNIHDKTDEFTALTTLSWARSTPRPVAGRPRWPRAWSQRTLHKGGNEAFREPGWITRSKKAAHQSLRRDVQQHHWYKAGKPDGMLALWSGEMRRAVFAFVVAIILMPFGCAHASARYFTSSDTTVSVGRGIRCLPQEGGMPDDPVIYRVTDMGKPDTPRLDARKRAFFKRIRRRYPREDLRFAEVLGRMLVFRVAGKDVCSLGAHNMVLDGWCDEYYMPGENPRRRFPSGECWSTPPPWGWNPPLR